MESSSNYSSLSCQELANALTLHNVGGMCKNILLIDVRPSAQHCCKHIASSENVNFSSILLRRLSKGVADLKSLLHYDQTLCDRLASRNSEQELLVLYDSTSNKASIRTDLVKHGDVLAKTKHGRITDCNVYFLDGGFEAFSAAYPQHCASSAASKKAHSPLGISVSASLPVFSLANKPTPTQKLCTPSEDSNSRFGPPVQILPHLVLGAAKDSSNLTQLRKMGVTAVLNVSNNCPNHFESILEYKCIAVEDSYLADLLSKMENAIQFIDSVKAKGGCVFVHCHAGISRSATISISYIMKTMNWELSKAYEFVKHKRPCISPNLHFMGQLLEFEKQLKEQQGDLVGSDGANSVDAPSTLMSTHKASSPFQPIPVPKHLDTPVMEECDNFFCTSTSAVPSASAPSSLHCEQTEENTVPSALIQTEIFECSLEAKTTPTKPKNLPIFGVCQSRESDPRVLFHIGTQGNEFKAKPQQLPAIRKPTSLPLLQVKCHTPRHSDSDSSAHRLLRQRSTPVQSITSLPTTPDNHFRNHTLSSSSSSAASSACSSVRLAPHSLQNSPCRVEALLGSGPESPLNFHANGDFSL